MTRDEKTALVEVMTETFRNTPHIILTSFQGLTVNQATNLRRRIRGAGGRYIVIRNRLAKRAAAGTAVEPLASRFQGPCAVATHGSDPVVLAKTLVDFSKENPQLEFLAGLIDSRSVVDPAGVKQLASLPGLDGLRAQLLALIQTPSTMLARVVGTPARQLARVIDARREQLGD